MTQQFKIGDKVVVVKEMDKDDQWKDNFPIGSEHEVKTSGFENSLYVTKNGFGFIVVNSDGTSSQWTDNFELSKPKIAIKPPDLCKCPMNVLMNRGCICGKK